MDRSIDTNLVEPGNRVMTLVSLIGLAFLFIGFPFYSSVIAVGTVGLLEGLPIVELEHKLAAPAVILLIEVAVLLIVAPICWNLRSRFADKAN